MTTTIKSTTAYKLLSLKKDGSIGPLFINRRQRLTPGVWYHAEAHRTKGYAFRPGWHCLAPHLTMKGRIWARVQISDFETIQRPDHQGGVWYLAQTIMVIGLITEI